MTSIHRPAALLVALLLAGCPSTAPDPGDADDGFAEASDDGESLLTLSISDEIRIDEEEALAESVPPIVAGASELLSVEGIPHHDPRFHDHYEEAVLLLEESAPGDAIDALRMAVFDAPDSGVTWLLLGETYFSLGRTRQAFDCVVEALSHDSDLPAARAFMAGHYLDRGDPETARPHAERFAKLAPEDAGAQYMRARTYMGLQMWEEAIEASRRAISRDPEMIDAYNSLGFSALQIGRNGLARQYLEAATELPGLKPWMLNNLGVAYERAGRDVDALQVFADAYSMDPAYTQARVNRDRVRVVVDRNVADEVSRILAERASSGSRPDPTAEASTETSVETATP